MAGVVSQSRFGPNVRFIYLPHVVGSFQELTHHTRDVPVQTSNYRGSTVVTSSSDMTPMVNIVIITEVIKPLDDLTYVAQCPVADLGI